MATLLELLKHDKAAAMLSSKETYPTLFEITCAALNKNLYWHRLTICEAYDFTNIINIPRGADLICYLNECFLDNEKEITLDYSQITDIEVEDIDYRDAPDFCDAYISRATYFGREMTELELEILNNNSQFVYDTVISKIH